LKIAFIVNKFPKISETFILNQITGLIDLGHDVVIFAKSKSEDSKTHCEINKYKLNEKVIYLKPPQNKIIRVLKAIFLISINIFKNPLIILRSLNIFKFKKDSLSLKLFYTVVPFLKNDFDILQCHFGKIGNIGATLKEIGIKGKLVTMFHGSDIRKGVGKNKDYYKKLIKYGDCFLAISNYNYENLVAFGMPIEKIIYHPVGIDTEKFVLKNNYAFNIREKRVIISTVARLVEEKGLKYGIEAVAKVLKRNKNLDLKYYIIGSGYLEKNLKNLVKQLGLENNIFFLGEKTHEEVIEIMNKTDIFILPSIAEALPVVLMEAQAIGLPVIATSVGSVDQVVMNGKSGFIVPKMDSDALAEKMVYLIDHHNM
jgi:colanic acid/amylovoran biosynthesis glycosyltransferase